MITTSHIRLPLLALVAAFAAAPLVADEMTVRGEQVYQEAVSFADLDLRSWSHQQALKRRVHKASERVCIAAEGPIDYDIGFMGGESCVDSTYAATRPQLRGAIALAKAGRQLATNLTVTGPARAR
jgi:UrcA family protein